MSNINELSIACLNRITFDWIAWSVLPCVPCEQEMNADHQSAPASFIYRIITSDYSTYYAARARRYELSVRWLSILIHNLI